MRARGGQISTCSYVITFVSPLLCHHPLIAPASATRPKSKVAPYPRRCRHRFAVSATAIKQHARSLFQETRLLSQVADYLFGLQGTCFYRVEGWWTYEFCYQKHLKQFHQAAAPLQEKSHFVRMKSVLGPPSEIRHSTP